MRAMYKYELAQAAGVSRDTMRNWMRSCHDDLTELGVTPRSKMLTPAAVKYLCRKFVIELDIKD